MTSVDRCPAPQQSKSHNVELSQRRADVLWRLHDTVVVVLLTLMIGTTLWRAFGEETFGISVTDGGGVIIRDFAGHLTFAKAFWSSRAEYTVESHVNITNAWCGHTVGRALPFGYSPTMLWLLAPLCGLPLVWGFATWTILGGGAVWWMTRRSRTVLLAGGLFLLTPLASVCFALGQTALLSAAALVFLMLRHHAESARGNDEQWSASLLLESIVLWALTAKPPLALVAGAALLAGRRWRTVLLAVGITLLATAVLTPKLGSEWASHYLHLMTHYDQQTADVAFAWSLRPDHMSNLRSLLWFSGVNDALASRLSSGIWLAGSIGILVLGLRGRLSVLSIWGFLTLAYLLLCPHVSSTEDLHLVVVIAIVATSGNLIAGKAEQRDQMRKYLPNRAAIALVILALLVVVPAPAAMVTTSFGRSAFVFLSKLSIVTLLCRYRRYSNDVQEKGNRASPTLA